MVLQTPLEKLLCKLNGFVNCVHRLSKVFYYSHSQEVNPLNIDYKGKSRLIITKEIAREIFRREGIHGYYRGYFTSLAMFAPNSALWWNFYQVFQGKTQSFLSTLNMPNLLKSLLMISTDILAVVMPANTSSLLTQCIAGTLGGFTGAFIMNPVDIIRSRIQVTLRNL